MPIEIRVPTLGESIVEATISKWLKHEGDAVAAGDAVAELETDKVNIEVMAEQAGVLEQITKREGENVGIGEVIGMIDTSAGASGAMRQDGGGAAAPSAAAAEGSPARTAEATATPRT